MPHKQRHRGPQSDDPKLFSKADQQTLKAAVFDYSFLLSRGYSEDALFKLVGDRYQLKQRQRYAVMRCACSTSSLNYRQSHQVSEFTGEPYLLVDGFNLLITLESALSGGYIFEGRDGCYRDLASLHASYKRVMETIPAINLVGEFGHQWGFPPLYWYLDKPVSNSGKLKQYLETESQKNGWPWEVELVASPDFHLKNGPYPVVSSDSYILDKANAWVNLAQWLISAFVPDALIVSLKPEEKILGEVYRE